MEAWTGPGIKPQVETSTIKGFENCVAADFVTLDPGLARIKFVVSDPAGAPILEAPVPLDLDEPLTSRPSMRSA